MKRRNFLGAAVGTVGAITGLRLVPNAVEVAAAIPLEQIRLVKTLDEVTFSRSVLEMMIPKQKAFNEAIAVMLAERVEEHNRRIAEMFG